MKNFAAVILAAGEGTRMKSEKSKVMHNILGKPLVQWVVDSCNYADVNDIYVVVGHKKEEIMNYLGESVIYAKQEKRLGTGHAVSMVKEQIKNYETVIVLCGDAPLIEGETIKQIYDFHKKEKNEVTVVTAKVPDPTGYGRIVKDENNQFLNITEQKDADQKTLMINEVNSGIYMFETKTLLSALSKLGNNNSQGEFYLTDTIAIINGENKKTATYVLSDYRDILGINNRVQLYQAGEILRERINTRHMLNGVTIIDPKNTYIEPNVEIGQDTIIEPGCQLKGRTKISNECIIGPDSILDDATIEENTTILKAVVLKSKIGSYTNVGPFAYIRPDSEIGSHVKIGDFVEIKKAKIDNGTKVSHLTYVGDAVVGKNVNFGCGTITVNYDGSKKHLTEIEDNVFIGCNSNLVAPVKVCENAFIAAGSTITHEVPKNALAIARKRQEVKEEWRTKRNGGK